MVPPIIVGGLILAAGAISWGLVASRDYLTHLQEIQKIEQKGLEGKQAAEIKGIEVKSAAEAEAAKKGYQIARATPLGQEIYSYGGGDQSEIRLEGLGSSITTEETTGTAEIPSDKDKAGEPFNWGSVINVVIILVIVFAVIMVLKRI